MSDCSANAGERCQGCDSAASEQGDHRRVARCVAELVQPVEERHEFTLCRAVWKSVERAGEWNAENPDAITPRLEDADAYRVVVVRLGVDR